MKLDYQTIEKMMKVLAEQNLEELEYEGPAGKVRLTASAEVVPAKTVAKKTVAKKDKAEYIVSEGIGTFYYIQSNGRSYVEVGKEIKVGETIGYVTSIGISTPFVSNCSGTVEEILVENGAVIDFGKKIIKVRK